MFVAPKIFAGQQAKTPVEGTGVETPDEAYLFSLESCERFGEDILLTYVK